MDLQDTNPLVAAYTIGEPEKKIIYAALKDKIRTSGVSMVQKQFFIKSKEKKHISQLATNLNTS